MENEEEYTLDMIEDKCVTGEININEVIGYVNLFTVSSIIKKIAPPVLCILASLFFSLFIKQRVFKLIIIAIDYIALMNNIYLLYKILNCRSIFLKNFLDNINRKL